MTSNKPTFIYGLYDPDGGQIRYVGKTMKKPSVRFSAHKNASLRPGKKRHLYAWLNGIFSSGQEPEMKILETVLPSGDWVAAEQKWIAHFKYEGMLLCNLTLGGDGCPGHVQSESHRAAISSSLSGERHYKYGKANPPHVAKALRLAVAATWADEAKRANLLARRKALEKPGQYDNSIKALAAVRCDPMLNASREARRVAALRTPEFRSGVAERSKESWRMNRVRIIEAQNLGKDAAYRAAQSALKLAQWKTPGSALFAEAERAASVREKGRIAFRGRIVWL